MKRSVIGLFIVQIALSGYCVDVPLHRGTVVRFATVEEGRVILGTLDDYVRNTSAFERQAILESRNPVTVEEFLEWAANEVQAWDDEQVANATVKIKRGASMLEKLDLNLPEVIYLIQTPGGGYSTRQNAIDCPSDINEYILVHEIFHIFSRYNPTIRDELYSILGYHPCGAPIKYPDSVLKITNPDAPVTEHYITVRYRGEPLTVAPIYYSKSETYRGGGLFDYIQYGLMAVEESSEGWTYKLVNGEPLILKESDVEGYWNQVGENTDYDIHPEERMAENFRILCAGRPGHYWQLSTPRIIEEMDALLAGPREYPEIITEPLREFTEALSVDYWVDSVRFSPDGSRILTRTNASSLGTIITTWDAATGLKLDTFSPGRPGSSEFSPDGTYILVIYNATDKRAELWSIQSKQRVYTLQLSQTSDIGGYAFSPDGAQFLTVGIKRGINGRYSLAYITFWETATGLELNTIPIEGSTGVPVYSPDASQILIRDTLYDVETGDAVQRFEPTNMIQACAFSPDGTEILTGEWVFYWFAPDFGGAARLWNAATGEEFRSFAFAYPSGVSSVQFSLDGTWILTGGSDNTVTLWDGRGEEEIRLFHHPETTRSGIFSPDGNYILTSCDDGIVRLWDTSDLVEPTAVDEWQLY